MFRFPVIWQKNSTSVRQDGNCILSKPTIGEQIVGVFTHKVICKPLVPF